MLVMLVCICLVSCGSSSGSGSSPAEDLPEELEKYKGILSHIYNGGYFRLTLPDGYWAQNSTSEADPEGKALIYTVNDELRELAISMDGEFDPDWYNVWIFDEHDAYDTKTAFEAYEEWKEYGDPNDTGFYELNPDGLDVTVYVVMHGKDYFKTAFAFIDNPDSGQAYISAGLWNADMEEAFFNAINNLEYVK